MSDQQSCYRAFGRGPAKIKRFVEIEFKYFQKLAQELNADIAFEDESCIGCGNHSGQTWGLVGQPPEIKACDESNRSDPRPQALPHKGAGSLTKPGLVRLPLPVREVVGGRVGMRLNIVS